MKFCQPHWERLRAAIAVRGLSHLGAQNAREAHADAVAQIEGEATSFDPLMSAHWAIVNAELAHVGLKCMAQEDWCPLCSVEADQDGDGKRRAQGWIDGACDDALRYAVSKGLVNVQ